MKELVTVKIMLPSAIPAEAVGEALRAFMDSLHLTPGSTVYESSRELTVSTNWPSKCAAPRCDAVPSVRLPGKIWCSFHGSRIQREIMEAKP